MKIIKDADIKGKKVLLRVDFNVPLKTLPTGETQVVDVGKIKAVLPTLEYLIANGAKIILLSHLGRPEGKEVPEYRLDPVALRLQDLIGKIVTKCYSVFGKEAEEVIEAMKPGELVMLSNLRFYPGEEANDSEFAKKIAKLGDIYVNDAFAVSHRAHASVEAITHFLPSYGGLLMEREVRALSELLQNPRKPFALIMGGAKAKDKLPVIKNLQDKFDYLLTGGVIANSFIAATSVFDMGKSKYEAIDDEYHTLIDHWNGKQLKKFYQPIDCVVSDKVDGGGDAKVIGWCEEEWEMPKDGMVLDIGPETIKDYKQLILKAKTILWNGNMGMSEVSAFAKGTEEIAKAIVEATENGAVSIIAGGDTGAYINQAGLADKVTYVSTGGGAALEFLAGKKLPGIVALDN